MTTPRKAQVEKTDAISILTADHKKVQKLFGDFAKLQESGSDAEKDELVSEICTELTMHADAEEAIFYPAVRAAIDDDDLMDEAEVEHQSARDLIWQLQSLESGSDRYDAKVTVLGEYIDHHVQEEQNEMFPKAKKADLDLEDLGEQILQFKNNWDETSMSTPRTEKSNKRTLGVTR